MSINFYHISAHCDNNNKTTLIIIRNKEYNDFPYLCFVRKIDEGYTVWLLSLTTLETTIIDNLLLDDLGDGERLLFDKAILFQYSLDKTLINDQLKFYGTNLW